MHLAVIALGSNDSSTFDRGVSFLCDTLDVFEKKNLSIIRVSHFYRTLCFPANAGPDFINAVVLVKTDKSPHELLKTLHEIEAHFGRVRKKRWAQRTLDLDIICIGDLVLPNAGELQRWMKLPLEQQMQDTPQDLLLPHPRLQDRAFVLVPMADVAADWCHPILGLTVLDMLKALPKKDIAEVLMFADAESACKTSNVALNEKLLKTTSE